MRRFYASSENINNGRVVFDSEQQKHIYSVLRLEAGEQIIVSDGSGYDYYCTLLPCGQGAEVLTKQINENEPKTRVTLFQAVIKNEKMDIVIQKAAELGITQIVPVLSARCVVKINGADKARRAERWHKIAMEACKQCGRSRIPEVCLPVSLAEAAEMIPSFGECIMAYEQEKTTTVSNALKNAETVAYFIGPEGGFEDGEHQMLIKAGATSVTLGRRILRAETAAIALGAVILYQKGEMNG